VELFTFECQDHAVRGKMHSIMQDICEERIERVSLLFCKPVMNSLLLIRESVDSLCRDGADMPIVRVHTKAF